MNEQKAKNADEEMVGPKRLCKFCHQKKVLSPCFCCLYAKESYGYFPGGHLGYNICNCFETCCSFNAPEIHRTEQKTDIPAWYNLLTLIDEVAKSGKEVFNPGSALKEQWQEIVTLPKEIAKLKDVKTLYLYGSCLTWIPPEIGHMESLENFDPYTSYKLHWLPYEIAHCPKLRDSRISTRTLYGNYKYRLPFPNLKDNFVDLYKDRIACGVCKSQSSDNWNQLWISLCVATDVVPLLVNLCSQKCLQRLPAPANDYVQYLHKGGLDLVQPPTRF